MLLSIRGHSLMDTIPYMWQDLRRGSGQNVLRLPLALPVHCTDSYWGKLSEKTQIRQRRPGEKVKNFPCAVNLMHGHARCNKNPLRSTLR